MCTSSFLGNEESTKLNIYSWDTVSRVEPETERPQLWMSAGHGDGAGRGVHGVGERGSGPEHNGSKTSGPLRLLLDTSRVSRKENSSWGWTRRVGVTEKLQRNSLIT